MFKKILFSSLFFLVLSSCSSPLAYQDDLTLALNSAQANSPEFPIYVGAQLCKDSDGNPGFCSKRVVSNQDISFHIDAQPYQYDLAVKCTQPIVAPGPFTVASGQALDFKLVNSAFVGSEDFICAGQLFPQDRPQPLSALWEVRFMVTDAAYLPREQITATVVNGKNVLTLGAYARDAWVFDGSTWTHHHQDTTVEVPDFSKAQAYSESYQMRYNYFNMQGPISTPDARNALDGPPEGRGDAVATKTAGGMI